MSIMLYVLVAGVMWGTCLSLGRTTAHYDAVTFLTDGHYMISNLATIMAVLMTAAVVLGLITTLLLLRRDRSAAGWLALTGLTLMVGVLVVTLAVEVPHRQPDQGLDGGHPAGRLDPLCSAHRHVPWSCVPPMRS